MRAPSFCFPLSFIVIGLTACAADGDQPDTGTHEGGLVARGQHYAQTRGCPTCHQDHEASAPVLAGSMTLVEGQPAGIEAFGPNLTPDTDTGLGSWSDQQIIDAMRLGVDDEGAPLCVMPKFSDMSDAEAAAIVAYLRSLPAISNMVSDSTCPWDLDAGSTPDAAHPDVVTSTDASDVSSMPTDAGARDSGTTVDVAMIDASVPDAGVVDVPTPPLDAGCTAVLVVNEVQTGGTASASDEFVEIHNTSACAASLANYELRYASAAGTTASLRWLGAAGDMIAAHGYVFVVGPAYSGSGTPLGMFSGTSGTLAAAGGGIGLFDPTGMRIDSVGYGTATNPLVEGTSAAAPAAGSSIARTPDGRDADDNSTDFAVATTPTPGAAN